MVRPDWDQLADRLGPQFAEYMLDPEWEGLLRTIKCRCGASIAVLDDGGAIPPDMYLCDACTLKEAFTIEEEYAAYRKAHPEEEAYVDGALDRGGGGVLQDHGDAGRG